MNTESKMPSATTMEFVEKAKEFNREWVEKSNIDEISKLLSWYTFNRDIDNELFLLLPFYGRIALCYRLIKRIESMLKININGEVDSLLEAIDTTGNSKITFSTNAIEKLKSQYEKYKSTSGQLIAVHREFNNAAILNESKQVLVGALYDDIVKQPKGLEKISFMFASSVCLNMNNNGYPIGKWLCRDFLQIYFEARDKNLQFDSPVDYKFFGELWPDGVPKKSCFIATACYGNIEHSDVILLRNFRDSYLEKTKIGIAFVKYYYKHSPNYAVKIEQTHYLKQAIKIIFLRPITFLIRFLFY